jgi:hypothetical protein
MSTELQFHNLAVQLPPTHLAFRSGIVSRFTIHMGTPIQYQFIGDDTTDTTIFCTGGGLQNITNLGANAPRFREFVGTLQLSGVLYYGLEPQFQRTEYTGSVRIKIPYIEHPFHRPHPPLTAILQGTIHAIGVGFLEGVSLTGRIEGKGTVSYVCGVQRVIFREGSILVSVPL